MSDFVLYNYFRSSTSYRARIALNLKSIPFDYKSVHLLNNGGEQHSAEYKKLNPQGEVPTLVHKGKVISQSVAIIEYLDDIKTIPLLYPQDPYMRAKVRQFCENINSFLHPLSNLKVLQKLEADHGYTQEQKNQWTQHWFKKGFEALEKMLADFSEDYCFGNTLTAADVFLVPVVFTAQRFKVDLTPYKKCLEINDRCLKLEAFAKAHPYRQPDTPQAEKM